MDETGDATVTFRDYWNDLTALSQGNLVEADNERTALIMYEELATQIISRAADFKNDGVTADEMRAQLANMREHLGTDFQNVSAGNQAAIQAEIADLENKIGQAERMIQSAYGQSGQAEGVQE